MLSKIPEKIKNLPLSKKILVITLSTILLFSFFLLIGYALVIHSCNDLLYQTSGELLSFASNDITRNLNTVENMADFILEDSRIQSALSECKDATGNTIPSNAYSSIHSSVNSYYQKYKSNYVDYVQIVNDKFSAMASSLNSHVIPTTVQNELINLAVEQDGRLLWVTDYNDTYGVFLIREIRRINHLSLDNLGVLIINVNISRLQEDISNMNTIDPISYALYADKQKLYLSKELDGLSQEELHNVSSSSYTIKKIMGLRYFIIKGIIDTTEWDYYCLTPYDKLYKNMKLVQKLFLVLIFASIISSIIIINLMMKPLMAHFDVLIHKIRAFGNDHFELLDISYPYQKRKDEIGLIHQQFDTMAKKIQILIRENYETEIQSKEAQLKALEMQINPHFLYNTLQTINWRAKLLHDDQISLITESLGKLLHITLSKNNENSSLYQELELVQYYINIQKMRFDEVLSYETNIPEPLLHTYLPKFTLQPLVENAIRYSLEEESENCYIRISASCANKCINILVENTGSVFEEHLLQKLLSQEIIPHGFGIGILNVNKRLNLAFGDDYSMKFINQNNYATVSITIPYQIKEQEH